MNRDKTVEPDDDQRGDDDRVEPADTQPTEHDIAHRAAMHD